MECLLSISFPQEVALFWGHVSLESSDIMSEDLIFREDMLELPRSMCIVKKTLERICEGLIDIESDVSMSSEEFVKFVSR